MIQRAARMIVDGAYAVIPLRVRHRIRRLRRPWSFSSTTPVSDHWGYDRGNPVDRYYIESFLTDHRDDIGGRVVEVMDTRYTERFGSHVTHSDVLDIDGSNPRATIIADLADATGIANDTFDCIVLTQVLQLIFDLRAAVSHLERILKPGGVLLATVPGISRIGTRERGSDLWRFTPESCRRLFAGNFRPDDIEVQSYGSLRTATAFLTGLAAEELSREELEAVDPFYPVIIGVRARKQA